MSEVDDNKAVIVKIFKTLDLVVDFAIWRAFRKQAGTTLEL
jgi:hypothetical protein